VLTLAQGFQITPPIRAALDRHKQVIAGWAADPVVVTAVKEQNAAGPLAGMDNPKWKGTRRSDPAVKQLQSNPPGQLLRRKLEASESAYNEAFLNGARGQKVAFVEKTTSYIHTGQAKFDAPFSTGKAWQGKPEFDESSQTYAIQISVPVLDGGASIGVLVVGVNLSQLEKTSSR